MVGLCIYEFNPDQILTYIFHKITIQKVIHDSSKYLDALTNLIPTLNNILGSCLFGSTDSVFLLHKVSSTGNSPDPPHLGQSRRFQIHSLRSIYIFRTAPKQKRKQKEEEIKVPGLHRRESTKTRKDCLTAKRAPYEDKILTLVTDDIDSKLNI